MRPLFAIFIVAIMLVSATATVVLMLYLLGFIGGVG